MDSGRKYEIWKWVEWKLNTNEIKEKSLPLQINYNQANNMKNES